MLSGKGGTEDLGGPIRIAELAGEFWSKGLQDTLWFMMILSLNLGLIKSISNSYVRWWASSVIEFYVSSLMVDL